ncbi:MAG: hypothetical protein JSV86_16520 [Gemmatimonadota bacterium]|nr:MAG: hypothetical protein JSV86_16520 [Gemmatimonadota bacterium]
MKSAIFSVLSSIVLALLMRAPAPTTQTQECPGHHVAQQSAGRAIPARIIETPQDTILQWLAGQDHDSCRVATGANVHPFSSSGTPHIRWPRPRYEDRACSRRYVAVRPGEGRRDALGSAGISVR